MKILLLITCLIFLLTACGTNQDTSAQPSSRRLTVVNPENWKVISNTDEFCFAIPASFENVEQEGIDSLVVELEGPLGRLRFDFGAYSPKPKNPNVLIDGIYAELEITESKSNMESYSIYFLEVDSTGKSLSGHFYTTKNESQLAETIFGTVRFGTDCE